MSRLKLIPFSFHYSFRVVRTNKIWKYFHRSHSSYKKTEIWQKHPRRNNGRTKAVAITLIYVFGWIIFFELFVANLHVVTIRATLLSFFLSLSSSFFPFPFFFFFFFLSPFIFFSPLATSFDNGGSGNILNNVTSFRPSASRNRGI